MLPIKQLQVNNDDELSSQAIPLKYLKNITSLLGFQEDDMRKRTIRYKFVRFILDVSNLDNTDFNIDDEKKQILHNLIKLYFERTTDQFDDKFKEFIEFIEFKEYPTIDFLDKYNIYYSMHNYFIYSEKNIEIDPTKQSELIKCIIPNNNDNDNDNYGFDDFKNEFLLEQPVQSQTGGNNINRLIKKTLYDSYIIWFHKIAKSVYYRNIFKSDASLTLENIALAITLSLMYALLISNFVDVKKLLVDELSCLIFIFTYIKVVQKNKDIVVFDSNVISGICLVPYYAVV